MAKWALAWVVPAVVLTSLQVVELGRITPPVVALDVIAGTLLPFGLLSLALALEGESHPEDGQGEDDGGTPPESPGPTPVPAGGLSIDWEQFEAEFRAYVSERELLAAHNA